MGFTNTSVVAGKKFSNHPNKLQTEMVAFIVFFTFLRTKCNKVFRSVARLGCCECTMSGRHLSLLQFALLGSER